MEIGLLLNKMAEAADKSGAQYEESLSETLHAIRVRCDNNHSLHSYELILNDPKIINRLTPEVIREIFIRRSNAAVKISRSDSSNKLKEVSFYEVLRVTPFIVEPGRTTLSNNIIESARGFGIEVEKIEAPAAVPPVGPASTPPSPRNKKSIFARFPWLIAGIVAVVLSCAIMTILSVVLGPALIFAHLPLLGSFFAFLVAKGVGSVVSSIITIAVLSVSLATVITIGRCIDYAVDFFMPLIVSNFSKAPPRPSDNDVITCSSTFDRIAQLLGFPNQSEYHLAADDEVNNSNGSLPSYLKEPPQIPLNDSGNLILNDEEKIKATVTIYLPELLVARSPNSR